MKYVYFISYWQADGQNRYGCGNCEISMNKEIASYDKLLEIEKIIQKDLKPGMKPTIMNYQLLRKEVSDE